ncbi:MAG: hypothetical protein PHU25_13260 [Deltaproteobacteria bacterium]|nr:hypothetical protein [Deltaproteobacteria bacterium]
MIESIAQRLDSGERTVVAGLGDSLTYGWLVERERPHHAALLRRGFARGLYQDDGVHPTDAGHALMAEGLIEAVCGPEAGFPSPA